MNNKHILKMLPLVFIILIVLFTGCTSQINNEDINNKQLTSFFSFHEKSIFKYEGVLDYSHTTTVKSIDKENDSLIINLNTEIDDLTGGASGAKEDFTFGMKYIIDNSSVREVYNKVIKYPYKPFSVNRTILKTPLKVGTTFINKFTYEDKEYVGETKIDEVFIQDNNENDIIEKITTITTIKDIDGFKNQLYTEINTYELNKGLIYTEFDTEIENIKFSYSLTEKSHPNM